MTQAIQCLLATYSAGLIYHLLHNSARSEIKVLLHNCQQFLLCLLRGAIIKQRYREGLCHSNGIRHLQEMSASVQYIQLHAVANQEHACVSHNLCSLQRSQQPTNGPHPTHYTPHLCNPFCLYPATYMSSPYKSCISFLLSQALIFVLLPVLINQQMTHHELILQTLKMLPPAQHVVLTPILRTSCPCSIFLAKRKFHFRFFVIHTVHVLTVNILSKKHTL